MWYCSSGWTPTLYCLAKVSTEASVMSKSDYYAHLIGKASHVDKITWKLTEFIWNSNHTCLWLPQTRWLTRCRYIVMRCYRKTKTYSNQFQMSIYDVLAYTVSLIRHMIFPKILTLSWLTLPCSSFGFIVSQDLGFFAITIDIWCSKRQEPSVKCKRIKQTTPFFILHFFFFSFKINVAKWKFSELHSICSVSIRKERKNLILFKFSIKILNVSTGSKKNGRKRDNYTEKKCIK